MAKIAEKGGREKALGINQEESESSSEEASGSEEEGSMKV